MKMSMGLPLFAALAVAAVPAFSTSPSCTVPGVLVATDPTGDAVDPVAGVAPDPVPGHDISALHIAEPGDGADGVDKIVVTLNVDAFNPAPPPNTIYYVRFSLDDGLEYFFSYQPYDPAIPDPVNEPGEFAYGHVESLPTGTNSVTDGPTDEGSQSAGDGTITWVLAKSKMPGFAVSHVMTAVTAETDALLGAPVAGGFLATVDTTDPNDYAMHGNGSCPESKSGLLGLGALPLASLLLGGLAALIRLGRRARRE